MFPLYPLWWEFYHGWMLNFLKCFFCIYWDNVIFILPFIMWYIILIHSWILNYPYAPGINPTWSWYIILFMYWWIQFANILLRNFSSIFIKYWWYWPIIFFFVVSLSGLVSGQWLSHGINLGVFHPFQFFGIFWEGWVLPLVYIW